MKRKLATWAALVVLAAPIRAATPVLFFSDLTDGPRDGGDTSTTVTSLTGPSSSSGAYVCVWGKNFGVAPGSIVIGGVDITSAGTTPGRIVTWLNDDPRLPGTNLVTGIRTPMPNPPMARACFQLGNGISVGNNQDLTLTTSAGTSNALKFNVRPDGQNLIYFVCDGTSACNGNNNLTGANGHWGQPFADPWWPLSRVPASSIIYVRALGNTFYRNQGVSNVHFSGTATAYAALIGYPNEDVQVGRSYRIQTNMSCSFGFAADYNVVANLRAACSIAEVQFSHQRIVGNDITFRDPGAGGVLSEANGLSGYGGGFITIYGNYIHDVAHSDYAAKVRGVSSGVLTVDYLPRLYAQADGLESSLTDQNVFPSSGTYQTVRLTTFGGTSPTCTDTSVAQCVLDPEAGTRHLASNPPWGGTRTYKVTNAAPVWSSSVTYDNTAVVGYNVACWRSLANPNLNNRPLPTSSFWEITDCTLQLMPSSGSTTPLTITDAGSGTTVIESVEDSLAHISYNSSDYDFFDFGWNVLEHNVVGRDLHPYYEYLPSAGQFAHPGYYVQFPAKTTRENRQGNALLAQTAEANCAGHPCASQRTYYVSWSYQTPWGETLASHAAPYTVNAGYRLNVTSPVHSIYVSRSGPNSTPKPGWFITYTPWNYGSGPFGRDCIQSINVASGVATVQMKATDSKGTSCALNVVHESSIYYAADWQDSWILHKTYGETHTAATSVPVKYGSTYVSGGDVLTDHNSSLMTKTTGLPNVGQYRVDPGGVFVFNPAETGKIRIGYSFTYSPIAILGSTALTGLTDILDYTPDYLSFRFNVPNPGSTPDGSYTDTSIEIVQSVDYAWNVYVCAQGTGCDGRNDWQATKQNATPIIIGTDWLEPLTGLRSDLGIAPSRLGEGNCGAAETPNAFWTALTGPYNENCWPGTVRQEGGAGLRVGGLKHVALHDNFVISTVRQWYHGNFDPFYGGVRVWNNLLLHNLGESCLVTNYNTVAGPAPYGTMYVENNTCYDANSGLGTSAAMIEGGEPFCPDPITEMNNNIFWSINGEKFFTFSSGNENGACLYAGFHGSHNLLYGNDADTSPNSTNLTNTLRTSSGSPNVVNSTGTPWIPGNYPSLGTNPNGYDFHIAGASGTLYGAGGASSATPSTDYDGVFRPTGGRYDIGAYQYSAGQYISPFVLPSGQVGVPYGTQTLTAVNLSGTITWTVTSGALPAGLSGCDDVTGGTCAISGTPTTAVGSPFAFTIQASNGSDTVSQAYSLPITAEPALTITSACPPDPTQYIPYSYGLTVVNGAAPYTWDLSSGSLPDSANITLSGETISGTPMNPSSNSFTLRVTDSAAHTATQPCTMVVLAAPALLVTTACPLAPGTQNAVYDSLGADVLTATGGLAPYSWNLVSGQGTLPTGLNISEDSIMGTPTGTGTSSFRLRVIDSASVTADQACSLAIDPVTPVSFQRILTGGQSVQGASTH